MPDEPTEAERHKAFITELTADPRRAKTVAARWANRMAPNESLAFLEQACRMLAAGGEAEPAAVCFSHISLLDPAVDEASLNRLHARFLDFAPLGAIAPKDYRAYAKVLMEKTDPATAHHRFREVICAALDAGLVPYAAIFPDLRTLARAAGGKKAVEEAFLADRLLRSGALAGASSKVWQAAVPALEPLVAGDDELLALLIDCEPRDGSGDPEVAHDIRQQWFGLLARSGAGRMLSAEWFTGPGARCPMLYLFDLVDQADLPGWQADDGSVPDDDAQFSVAREFVPGDPADDRYTTPGWATHDPALQTFAAQVRDSVADPAARARYAEQLDGYVARFGSFVNVDYPGELARIWNAAEAVRELLRERVRAWIADVASTGLHGMDAALLRLSRLADAGYQNLDPEAFAAVAITDPADALLTTLRNGLPAELALPGMFGDPTKRLHPTMRVALDGTRLTVVGGWVGHVLEPGRQTVCFPASILPNDASVTLWHDGTAPRLARRVGDRRYSFHLSGVDRDPSITLDENPAWPRAAAEAEVVFPAASAATRVSSGDGFLYVHAPDGAVAVRIPFGGMQYQRGESRLVAPPAWWPYLRVVDVLGSSALRAVDEQRVRRLLAAGFHGPATAAAAVSEVLPDVTDQRLVAAVAEAAVSAARCVTNAAHLRRRLGLAQPESLPEFLRCRPEIPFYVSGAAVVGGRLLDDLVRDVINTEPDPGGALRLDRTVEVPKGALGFWYSGNLLGGLALQIAAPWTSAADRDRELERLQAMANTPQADGSRRWRHRDIKVDRVYPDPTGQLWRTPTSVLAVLSNNPSNTVLMAEYAPEGVFDPRVPEKWEGVSEYVRMPVWGGAEQVASFVRLLREKNQGPALFDAAQARRLAELTGISVGDAARACFGDRDDEGQPKEIRALYDFRDRGYREINDLRERLMPADPADLWRSGLAVEQAAAWWNSARRAG